MNSALKKYGAAIIWVLTGIVVILTALLFKGTPYQNAFFFILAIGIILASAFELYSRKKS